MEATPSAMLKLLLPRTPFLLKTALAHTLYLSETSSKWDLRTELTIKTLRSMIGPDSTPTSISRAQRITTKDPGIKGKMWISKFSSPVPATDEDVGDVRRLLLEAVDSMCTSNEERNAYDRPASQPLQAEWTGYRANVSDTEPEPTHLSNQEIYNNLVAETSTKVTTLYFHGGAMYLLDPAAYRPITSRIAKETGGRVFSVRYCLSPQNPFPAALLDALTAYLCLLYPPPGSPHSAIPASEIVFGGDSAGGMLCAALAQLLLQIHRLHHDKTSSSALPTVQWHNQTVALPLPAGLALTSPWLDTTRSLPSITALAKYDYLPPPTSHPPRFPPCPVWPTSPPRADLYSPDAMLLHPLVSPLLARNWTSCPPVLFSLGEEMLRDEDAVLARRLHAQGVRVVWREFEAMPHCFAAVLTNLDATRCHYDDMARFCRDVVDADAAGMKKKSDAQFILAKKLQRVERDIARLTELADDEVEDMCRRGAERIVRAHGDAVGEVRPML